MKTFQSLIPALGLIAAVQAWANDWNGTYVTTTVTTDIYTTFCPVATTIHQGTKTYTATASETLTITDCPCTYVTSHPYPGKPSTTAVPHSYVYPSSNATTTWLPPVYVTTTKTVDIYTTYCPAPTTVTQGTKTYVVTQETTLTITDCPCTEVTTVPAPSTEYTTSTFSTLTTYCPEPTTITHGGQTYPVSSGTVKIPIISVSALPPSYGVPISQIPDGQPQAPTAAPTPEPAPTTPVGTPYLPSATQSGPLQVTNAAAKNIAGVGAFAAAGLAMIL